MFRVSVRPGNAKPWAASPFAISLPVCSIRRCHVMLPAAIRSTPSTNLLRAASLVLPLTGGHLASSVRPESIGLRAGLMV